MYRFLWVSLQIEELCDPSHSERSFKSALQDLPEGLTATYERILEKISRRPVRQKALAGKIFGWTLCARRPLSFDELKDAVAVDLGDISWDERKVSAETDEQRFLDVCGNLVVFHERDNTVRLAHHTVGKFLGKHNNQQSYTDAKIGDFCLTYLGFSDFETQVVQARRNQDLFGPKTSRQYGFGLIPQVLGLTNGVYGFVYGRYNRSNELSLPYVNYAELMRRYQKKPLPQSLTQKYTLLNYVTDNWIWHAGNFKPNASQSWSRLKEFVFYKSLPFDFRPWGKLDGPSDLPYLSIYLWSLENNHLPLLILLKDVSVHRSLRPYLQHKTLCPARVPLHLLKPNTQTTDVDFLKHPDAYDWPLMKIFSEERVEMLELCLQEDPSIISYRHIMIKALQDANSVVVNCLLHAGATLLSTEINSIHALHCASGRGNTALVKILLRFGADVNLRLFQDERGRTPLYEALLNFVPGNHDHSGPCVDPACSYSTIDTVRLLLDHGADPNAKQIGDETALHKAIGLDDAFVQVLLSKGADVEARNDRQQSVLDLAAELPDSTIEILCDHGVSLEAKDDEGRTSLLKAVQTYPHDSWRAKRLVECGADVHTKNSAGKTVLHYVHSSSEGLLQYFLDLGVDVNARSQDGTTALELAVRESDYLKFKSLLASGAVFGAESKSPLTEAAIRGNKEIVDILLRMNHNPNHWQQGESSALFSAVKVAAQDVVTALLEAGADPNLVDDNLITPLTQAMMNRDKEIAKLLVQAGADIQTPDTVRFSPVYFAIASGQVHLVEFLIQQGLDTSEIRPSDTSVRRYHSKMRSFLTSLGIPFKVYDDYDD